MSKTGNKMNRFTIPQTTSVFLATPRKSGNSTVVTIPGAVVAAMELEGKEIRVLIEDNEDSSPKHLYFMSEDNKRSIGIWADGTVIAYDEDQDFEDMIHLEDPTTFAKVWKFIRELDNKTEKA